jgi:signal peptidase I
MISSKSEVFLAVAGGLLSRGRRVRFRAEGDSMHPTIRGGEAIIVEPVSPPDLENGDIALHHSRRGVTAHRVVRIESRGEQASVFLTRGDASDICDEPVDASKILGKVVSVERNGRTIDLNSLKARMVYALLCRAYRLRRTIRYQLSAVLRGIKKRKAQLSLKIGH